MAILQKGQGPVNSIQSVLFRAPELLLSHLRNVQAFSHRITTYLKGFLIAYQVGNRFSIGLFDREWIDGLYRKLLCTREGGPTMGAAGQIVDL